MLWYLCATEYLLYVAAAYMTKNVLVVLLHVAIQLMVYEGMAQQLLLGAIWICAWQEDQMEANTIFVH